MQGVGVFVFVVGYGLLYTAYEQGFGSGGSFLYWLTGNTKLGQPSQPDSNKKKQTNNPNNVQTPIKGGQQPTSPVGILGQGLH